MMGASRPRAVIVRGPERRRPGLPSPSPEQRRRAERIGQAMARLGFVLPGSVTVRRTTCGSGGCRCAADPPLLHGPYLSWTRKVAGRTVTRRLDPEQLADLRPWLEARRRLRELTEELEAIPLEVAEAELRGPTVDRARRTARPRKAPAT